MTITPITIRWRGRKRLWRLVLCCLVAWPAIAFAHDAEEDHKDEIARSSAVAQLKALLERSDERSLMLYPLNALSRGDVRYSDQFGDLVSDEYFQSVRSGALQDLQNIQQIERSHLSTNEQIAYDVFKYQAEVVVASFEMGVQQTIQDLPIDDYTGLHLSFPQWSSGRVRDNAKECWSMANFNTYLAAAKNYWNNWS